MYFFISSKWFFYVIFSPLQSECDFLFLVNFMLSHVAYLIEYFSIKDSYVNGNYM